MQRIVINILLTCLVGIFLPPSFGQGTERLLELLKNTQSMQADFVQTVTQEDQGRHVTYGQMVWKRPGQLRWEAQRPLSQLLVVQHNRLWIYDPDLQQITRRPLQHTSGLVALLLHSDQPTVLRKNFRITEQCPPGTQQRCLFQVHPRLQKDAAFTVAVMEFRKQKLWSIQWQDQLGQVTSIQFKNIRLNNAVPARWFLLPRSRAIDIIDET